MKSKLLFEIAGILLALSFCISGCSKKVSEEKEKTTVTIAAAASLKNCMEEKLIPAFEKKYPNITVKGIYDSSGRLQTQIESGLNVDCFFSASNEQMETLEKKGIVNKEDVCDVVGNKLVLIVPKDSKEKIRDFKDVVKAQKVAIGDTKSVPAGQYAKDFLEHMNLWEQVSKKASYGSNVTEILSWVEAGSADAGLVYQTDAFVSDKVKVVATAPESALSKPITYPVGILKSTKHRKETKALLDFIASGDASEILEKYGFEMEER